MSRLIISSLTRLFQRVIFWICFIGMFLYGVFMAFATTPENALSFSFESCFFGFAPVMGLVSAIFISLFIGSEYSDGTMRNKVAVGHTRFSIYLSNFIACSIANIFFCLAYILAVMVIGNMHSGTFLSAHNRIAYLIICAFGAVIAFTSIMTFLAMLNRNKAANVVVSMLLAITMLASGSFIYQRLCEPEMYDRYISVDSNGVPTDVDRVPNPQYVRGTEREVLELLNNFLPSGQTIQLADMFNSEGEDTSHDFSHTEQWPFYSLGITILTTAIGIGLYRRKEIK